MEPEPASFSGSLMDRDTFRSGERVKHIFTYSPQLGAYAEIVIENQGKTDILVTVRRPHTVGEDRSVDEAFSTVRIPVGKSLSRVILIDADGGILENKLEVSAEAVDESEVLVQLSAAQYRNAATK